MAAKNDVHGIEVWVLMDTDGNYAVGKDQEDAETNFSEDIGDSSVPKRMVCFKAKMSPPAPLTVTCVVPDQQEGPIDVEVVNG